MLANSTQTAELASVHSPGDRNEIRTDLKKFKGLGQGRNLIKMEIRPGEVQLCSRHGHSLTAIQFIFPGMLGKKEVRALCRLKGFLTPEWQKKAQSASVTVANGNLLSHTARFSYLETFRAVSLHLIRSPVLTACPSTFSSIFAAPRNAFGVLSPFCAGHFSPFIYSLPCPCISWQLP